MSLMKKLDSGLYRVPKSNHAERSFEDALASIRSSILSDHAELVMEARMTREKRQNLVSLVSERIVSQDIYVGRLTRRDLAERLVTEICGLGPIDDFLECPEITEIMVNGPNEVFVERNGKIEKTAVTFRDDAHVLDIINRIVGGVGRRVDRSQPYVDARLPDGSRVNAIIPPLSLSGPVLTIRRFPKQYHTLEELVELGTLEPRLIKVLDAAVKLDLDIVISGGSGSGKTTTLNILGSSIPTDERIIVIEDSREISIPKHHVVYLETRTESTDGKGKVTIRDLLRNALRMRPDRVIIGECRGKETLDLITAMNTGHEGCLSTVHANSSRDCLTRLIAMAMMSQEPVPLKVVESWLASALDIIVHQTRLSSGKRVIEEIAVVTEHNGNIISTPFYSRGHENLLDIPDEFYEKLGPNKAQAFCEALERGE